ncbi:lipid A deacylase LpxR family protein [Sulfurimonas sp. HSL3-7]|uniref:lipid A deacylase LpxR family protein n=1 Tax=Sulfonitrofixus jiaomeiensis TaxID=3131938 RepID=UPI0031F87046
MLTGVELFGGSVGGFIHNDVIFKTDQHYTNGLALGWVSDELSGTGGVEAAYTEALIFVADLIPFHTLDTGRNFQSSVFINQYIVTPSFDDNGTAADDIPFAGVLRMGFGLFEWDREELHSYHISVGVIGPSAKAEEVQNGFHDLINNDAVEGWDSQLGNKGFFEIGYGYGNRSYEYNFAESYRVDWFNDFLATAGNAAVEMELGTLVRIGDNVPDNFVFASQYLGSLGNEHINVRERNGAWGWSMSLGFVMRATLYNYIMEEAEKMSGLDVKMLNAQWVGNISMYIGDFQTSFVLQQTDIIINQDISRERYGGLTFIWAY